MPNKSDDQSPAAMYAWMLPHLQQVGNKFGYAIAVHGSMANDLDLIAVPWVIQAAPAETLVEAIRQAVGGFIRNDPDTSRYNGTSYNPNVKPHGRRGWAIQFSGFRFFIDLSVMPLRPELGVEEEDDVKNRTKPKEEVTE